MTMNPTGADILVQRLSQLGVTHIFGYPGGQMTPIYDALCRQQAIRHVLARHEQAAGFMADGYARASGQVGVCLAVCGPGVYNACTPLANAFTDSVPLLMISGQIPTAGMGLRTGYYHENEQLAAVASMVKHRARATSISGIVAELDRTFQVTRENRPGPAFLEIPLDLLREENQGFVCPSLPAAHLPRAPRGPEIEALARLVSGWHRPLILAGGGVTSAGAEEQLRRLAERLGAPVFTTLMGKTALSSDHPLKAGLPWSQCTADLTNMEPYMSPLFAAADGLLAIGCRFAQAVTGNWLLQPPSLAHIDIDAQEIGRHYAVKLGIQADARLALEALLATLPAQPRPPWTALSRSQPPWRLLDFDLARPLRQALPRDAIVVADICRLSYILLAEFPVYQPRTFLHPAGFVPMGYGIPAALGAKAAYPDRTVVAVAGDGCFQMSALELASAMQEKLPIVIVLVNDSCLSLIRATQERRYQRRFFAVDLRNPDFAQFARSFGVRAWQVATEADFGQAVQEAVRTRETALVEFQLHNP